MKRFLDRFTPPWKIVRVHEDHQLRFATELKKIINYYKQEDEECQELILAVMSNVELDRDGGEAWLDSAPARSELRMGLPKLRGVVPYVERLIDALE